VPVGGIRIAGRSTKGVTIFNTADGEKVVSVERISETESDEENGAAEVDETAAEGDAPAAGGEE
jgi:DNA gyrase subunit A